MKDKVVGAELCLLIALALALLIAAGCARSPVRAPDLPRPTAAAYVPETECQPCHTAIFDKHSHSRHAMTLHTAERERLRGIAPPAGPIPNTPYGIRAEGDHFVFYAQNDPRRQSRIDLVMGSGKLAVTYVSLMEKQTLRELRMSYYPSLKRWYVTPGQENSADQEIGYAHAGDESRACVQCHAVTVGSQELTPAKTFLGVGCQSCHGPASAHVAAMKSGKDPDLHIERMKTWGATRLNDMCGTCHRSSGQVGTSGNEITMTQRFQAYGLMQSPCFQKSGDRLSCIACHDAHSNAATAPRSYDAACLRCHSGSPPPPADANAVQSKVCPVNAKSDCVPCHMIKRRVFPLSKLPVAMADHLIWAYRKKPALSPDASKPQ